ncbi:MAG TPA: SRPBCC family protein [Burkholderiales bacterium]|nr:SRPBCC family protein [Burkholderiales bacterium]
MLKIIFLVLAILVAVLAIVVAMQPDEFRVSRSTTMNAPPAAVFAQVNDLHNWEKWNPWQKVDPAMKLQFSGPPSGVGAAYAWQGNKDVGEGRLSIIESRPSDLVRIKLEFLKPFAATNTAIFTFKPAGTQAEVTWAMEGRNNFLAKAIHLCMNMDKMVGGQFEQGLADMKAAVEAGAK